MSIGYTIILRRKRAQQTKNTYTTAAITSKHHRLNLSKQKKHSTQQFQFLQYLCCAAGGRSLINDLAKINKTTTKRTRRKTTRALNLYQYNSANCSRYLIITFPVSLDSPSARIPKEKGTSAMAWGGMWALTRRSNAILNPWELRFLALRN